MTPCPPSFPCWFLIVLLINSHLLWDFDHTLNQLNSYFRYKLMSFSDNAGLMEVSRFPSAHSWVTDGISLMTAKDYIKAIHIRYGVLHNKSRVARDSPNKDKSCRHGREAIESLNHILQVCHSMHYSRIKRHDALVKYVQKVSHDRGYKVHKESQFQVGDDILKPDLVIYSQHRVVVVDVQVVNDQYPPEIAHQKKVGAQL